MAELVGYVAETMELMAMEIGRNNVFAIGNEHCLSLKTCPRSRDAERADLVGITVRWARGGVPSFCNSAKRVSSRGSSNKLFFHFLQ